MSEKQDIIKRMVELQKKFIAFEQGEKDGVDIFQYYTPSAGHTLEGYREEFQELANKVVELAHAEVGSHA